jgi:hypothetical protein
MAEWTKQQAIAYYRGQADRHRRSAERLRSVLGEDPKTFALVDHYTKLADDCDTKADDASDTPDGTMFPEVIEATPQQP